MRSASSGAREGEGRAAARSAEAVTFTAATAVALLHALDDAFLGRQPGVGLGQHAPAAAVALAGGLAAIAAFTRLRPGLRAALPLGLGVLALVNGALHVRHVTLDGPAHSDLTGIAAAVAGVVLVGLALWIPFRHRGARPATARRRWATRIVAVVALAVLALVLIVPVSAAIVVTHKYREPIGAPPRAAYEPVAFRSDDGLDLAGWYVASRNRAAIVLVHGGGGDRTGAVGHAELLRRHGYGVLLYDSRGRGDSEGSPNALGWGWEHDVAGALQFLRTRPDVDPERVGGLGLSTGADVLIGVAAEGRALKALVADGATAASFADYRNAFGIDTDAPYFLALDAAARVLSGSSPPAPLEDAVADVAPAPLLLVAAGVGARGELRFNRVYAEAAREPVELWELPQGRHTAAIRERSREYERRVVGLFDEALGASGSG
jgi:uncharacterized protein